MKRYSGFIAFGLALIVAVAALSAKTLAASADSRVSARIIAPTDLDEAVVELSPGKFFSDVTGDLRIHLPGSAPSATHGDFRRSLRVSEPLAFESFAVESLGAVAESCASRRVDLAKCMGFERDGRLRGNPVSGLQLHIVNRDRQAGGAISVTLTFN